MKDYEVQIDELTEENGRETVDYSVRLPEAETDIMLAAWEVGSPFTSSMLMKTVGKDRGWKTPTLISFLTRLEYRGFLTSSKEGKERSYCILADREKYLSAAAGQFVAKYYGGSFVRMLDSLFRDREFSNSDIDELLEWLKNR